jgi:hypothetical protein
MANRIAELKALIESAEADFEKFYDKGNKAAGTRVRGKMMDLKKLAQDIRTEVLDSKKEETTDQK